MKYIFCMNRFLHKSSRKLAAVVCIVMHAVVTMNTIIRAGDYK